MTRKTAVVSSTTLDLPDHRAKVRNACLAADFFPAMMENLPAKDEDAIAASMDLVDKADVYIGIYGHRYGHIPKGHNISITEIEFNRALAANKTILPFLMSDKHVLTRDMLETGEAATGKLVAFKERVCGARIRGHFDNADVLERLVEGALKSLSIIELNARLFESEQWITKLKAAELGALTKLRERDRELRKLRTLLDVADKLTQHTQMTNALTPTQTSEMTVKRKSKSKRKS